MDERDEVTTVSPGVLVQSSPGGKNKVVGDSPKGEGSVSAPVPTTPSNVPKPDKAASSEVPATNTAAKASKAGGKVSTASFNKLGNILKRLIPKRVSMTPGAAMEMGKAPAAVQKAVNESKKMYDLGVDYFARELRLKGALEVPTYMRKQDPEKWFHAIVKSHPLETRSMEVPTFIRNLIRE